MRRRRWYALPLSSFVAPRRMHRGNAQERLCRTGRLSPTLFPIFPLSQLMGFEPVLQRCIHARLPTSSRRLEGLEHFVDAVQDRPSPLKLQFPL